MTEKSKKDWQKFKETCELDGMLNESEIASTDETIHEGALEHPSYIALQEKLDLAEKAAHENWEKSVRAAAELDNIRRRADRDVANAHRYGLEKILNSLLPIVDSLEQAIQLVDKDNNPAMDEGLQLTMKLFLDVLKKHDVEQLNPEGELFDPNMHEAMSIQTVENVAPNTVVMVFQKGYRLNDRVIRPARVIVSKAN